MEYNTKETFRLAFFVLCALIVCPNPAFGQRAAQSTVSKYWVFFTDKPANSAKVQAVDISAESIDRRRRRASTQSPTRTALLDQPVAGEYIASLARLGVQPVYESRWLNAISVELTPEQASEIEQLSFVRGIRPVGTVVPNLVDSEAIAQASEPERPPFAYAKDQTLTRLDYGPSLTQLQLMNAVDPIERGFIGTDVVIGFIDTEFDTLTHSTFENIVSEDRLIDAQFFTPGPQTNRHGVQVASAALGYTPGQLIGPAHGARVLLATTEYAPTETKQEEDAFVAGMEWMESQGVDVVNSSLGYTTFDGGQNSYTTAQLDGDTGITTQIVDVAVSLGVVVVTSAGNEGCGAPNLCWYYIGTPADADSVISVGATNASGAKVGFSSFGPTADGRTKPEVSAMGQSVYLAFGSSSFGNSSGTSFSSPLVAGVAAQILQANPDLTPMQVRQILMDTASQSAEPDNELGWGIVDAGAAVDLALSMKDLGADEAPSAASGLQLRIDTVFPNPAQRESTIVLHSSDSREITVELFDTIGRRVYRSNATRVNSGMSSIDLPLANVATGMYTLRVSSGEHDQFRRLAVIK